MSQERGVKQKKEASTERQRERCAKRGRCDKKNVKRKRCHEKEMPKEEMPREMPSYTVLATARGSDTLKCMGKTLCLGHNTLCVSFAASAEFPQANCSEAL